MFQGNNVKPAPMIILNTESAILRGSKSHVPAYHCSKSAVNHFCANINAVRPVHGHPLVLLHQH